ncbi:hypothetical protein AKO1_013744 [Acrasis kona]|uniref:SUI1 domain-containing protein n=1 Tax=Acrasis kona TaxID=1008807 RepID=A0AAW2ZIL3_9EUKA
MRDQNENRSTNCNLNPFKDVENEQETIQTNLIHLRVLQRTGRKRITIVEGLSDKLDLKKILKSWKKEFHVNGSVIDDDPKYEGAILKISGDCRQVISDFLINEGLAEASQIKVHGA